MFDRASSRRRRRRDGTDPGSDPDDRGGSMRELVVTFVLAISMAFLLQQFVVKPYRIPSGSMENTLRCADRVLVDRVSYRLHDPERFDIVVFHPPAGIGEGGAIDPGFVAGMNGVPPDFTASPSKLEEADTTYIKRIVGMPGDEIEVKGQRAYVDGKQLKEPFLHPIPENVEEFGDDFGPVTVPDDAYLALGDHRTHSADGRYFGWLPRDFIIGKAFGVYWPPKRFGGLPQEDSGRVSEVDEKCLEAGAPQSGGG